MIDVFFFNNFCLTQRSARVILRMCYFFIWQEKIHYYFTLTHTHGDIHVSKLLLSFDMTDMKYFKRALRSTMQQLTSNSSNIEHSRIRSHMLTAVTSHVNSLQLAVCTDFWRRDNSVVVILCTKVFGFGVIFAIEPKTWKLFQKNHHLILTLFIFKKLIGKWPEIQRALCINDQLSIAKHLWWSNPALFSNFDPMQKPFNVIFTRMLPIIRV